ncbi:MAG: putative DNA binding domain-containing protein [Desulfovibrionaceae bacterium]|nr:putative DNA binding domain-containing protein [Desulfovibrionaceae bacterium]
MPMNHHFSDAELEALLDDLESDRVERKESFNGGNVREKARQAVCAFANDLPGHNAPGVLFIGVTDKGRPTGLPVTDALLRELADMHSDGKILPLPVMTVEKRRLKGADMAVITVLPSDMPPVRYDGRIWIRIGSRRAIASAQEERILNEKRRYKDIPFDINPVPSSGLDTLSRLYFENEFLPAAFAADVLEANGRSYEERLASCRMIASPDDPTPTVLGLLVLGISPQDFLPGAEIQFLRINGVELADDVVDEALLRGNIAEQLRSLREKIMAHNRTAVDIVSGPTHRMEALYPVAALDQLVYNAVLHRTYEGTNTPVRVYWYNDRIEIVSPGGPYGNVTCENFGKPGITDYRNPNLASAMKTLGFIQQFGRGIATARKLMEQNGNPAPEFRPDTHNVLCIVRERA